MEQFSTFVWWQGRVEDRDDPLELGRCRVRILGFHSDDKGAIPTASLPWAYPAMPINSRPGDPPVGSVVGTWVMGFFRDGTDAQEPVMTHIIDSGYLNDDDVVNNSLDSESDPDWGGKKSMTSGEINTNRLARGETAGTYVVASEASDEKTIVERPNTAGTVPPPTPITTPDLGYDASYPHNKVEESQSGHVTEVDDTPGSERLSKVHSSGTLEVIKSNGDRVVKIIGEDFELVVGAKKSLKVKGDLNIDADGDINFKAGGSIRFESAMQFRVKAPLATQIESAFVLVTTVGGRPGAIFNVNGGITQIGSPFVLPGPGFPSFPDTYGPDLPDKDISLPDKPDTITLGE
jgi:hypothetical protein